MIMINEQFGYENDQHNWILVQFIQGKTKEGEPKTTERRTYHGSLPTMLTSVLDKSIKGCDSLKSVQETIKQVTDSINKLKFIKYEFQAVKPKVKK